MGRSHNPVSRQKNDCSKAIQKTQGKTATTAKSIRAYFLGPLSTGLTKEEKNEKMKKREKK